MPSSGERRAPARPRVGPAPATDPDPSTPAVRGFAGSGTGSGRAGFSTVGGTTAGDPGGPSCSWAPPTVSPATHTAPAAGGSGTVRTRTGAAGDTGTRSASSGGVAAPLSSPWSDVNPAGLG